MWIEGKQAEVDHCQHVSPKLFWIENEPGKAPQFAYIGFPRDGQVVLSKNRVVVLCRYCSMPTALTDPASV